MTTQRLTFLYPHLFQSLPLARTAICVHSTQIRQQKQSPHQTRHITSTTTQKGQTIPQRYGTAQEPHPPPSSTAPQKTEDGTLAEAIEKEVKAPTKDGQKKADVPVAGKKEAKEARKPSFSELKKPTDPDTDTTSLREPAKAATSTPGSSSSAMQTMGQMADALHKRQPSEDEGKTTTTATTPPLAKVFEMPAPTVEHPEEHKAPHLAPPPYVHHFDTYTLVKSLESGGWTAAQSVTLMKAVRGLLGVNLDLAKEGLVGKSDVENETYLFRAACSELRTEILNKRRETSTTQRTQLHHLQHSADILSQRVSQEASSLKEDLRGMLNDRRMAAREQSQQRDSEISELNYRISARLNSDSKSEVEGLRWVLTRRAAIGIAGMAVLILGSLRYGSYRRNEMELEARRKEAQAEIVRKGSGVGGGGRYTTQSRDMGVQTDGADDDAVKRGEGVGYVSLG